MARHEITMPQLGESVTEGTVTRWLKQIGDAVAEDELLFEVSTDKVDSEVPSPAAGTLAEIMVEEGDTVDVGALLCVISDDAAVPAPAAEPEPGAAEPTPAPASAPEPRAPEPAPAPASAPQPPPPAPAPAAPAAPAPAAGDGASRVLSPIVRRLVAEHDVDLSQIQGTGSGDRVTRNDVMSFVEARNRGAAPAPSVAPPPPAQPAPSRAAEAPAPAPAPAPSAPATAAAPEVRRGERDEVVPFSNIRRRTAEHMVMSKATSPHVMMSIEVDFENVERVRAAHRSEWKAAEGFSLTYLPFIARTVCDAIRDFPNVNASVDGTNLVVHHYVNLGIAVDLDFEGLIVPVIRDAETKRLRQIAREIRDLADRARSKRLSPDELMGGTFTVTNPGPFGSFISAPVISQPQVAILSTEGVKKRPVVVEAESGDSIAIHHTGILAQVFDHRAFDGAYNAAFLDRLKEILETRDWASELG